MASATPSASVPGSSTSAPEERGAGGRRRHAARSKRADSVIHAGKYILYIFYGLYFLYL